MTDSPVRRLVAQTLKPFHRKPGMIDTSELSMALFADARDAGVEAITGSGVGLELHAGERVLASALLVDRPKGYEHRLAMAITDRRTAVSGWSSISGPGSFNNRRFSVAHAELTRVEVKTGMLTNHVALFAGNTKHELIFGELVQPLGALYQALTTQIAPGERVEPPTAWPASSDADPAGAHAAAQALWNDDPLARQALETIDRNVRHAGMPAEMGRDLVARVVLAHRTSATAPAMREGRWLSPMSAQDLGGTLVRFFGAPMTHAQPQPGVEQLDFRIDPKRDVLYDAVTALGVASYIGLGVGFRPGAAIADALLRKQQVTQLRVMFADQAGGAAYRLFAPPQPLEPCDSRLAQRLHLALGAASYSVLLRRAERGWGPSYAELFPKT
ncbi:hypothetical protein [Sandaracinus amylolyticus]|uniref:Uncharacterized protein n=1 Tax=Sandaracinus amylolyticus TaxID=927083 RepID=A0A0F6VYW5_9BACT|nr:hypothetical protein [Sandaracinus amylolyticus]AKF03168.1 hypothetical protein DB32_000317 [Sandaracinus amylolyticus]